VAAGFLARRYISESRISKAEINAKAVLAEADKEAERLKREALVEAKEKAHTVRTEAERDLKSRRSDLQRLERRLMQREESLEGKEVEIEKRDKKNSVWEGHLKAQEQKLVKAASEQKRLLEKIARMTADEASRSF